MILLPGSCLSLFADMPALQAFGLGLVVPGGGFLPFTIPGPENTVFQWLLAAGSLAAFGVSLVLWFATGAAIAPPMAWLLAAVAGALLHRPAAVGETALLDLRIAVPCIFLSGLFFLGVALPVKRRYWPVSSKPEPISFKPCGESARPAAGDELAPEDLARLRFLLDRALQPVEEFEGFEWIDQFQSAAVRYQLNFAGFALALAQNAYLPAMRGYFREAQANLIEKQRDPRIWRYWKLENLWGNFKADGNPFGADNIMYTGFCAAQIALFQAANDDFRFSLPNSFSLHGRRGEYYPADFGTLVACLQRQYATARLGLIACEPNWVFPLCNSIGFTALIHHDKRFGSGDWQADCRDLQDVLQREFLNPAGQFVTCRSSHTGFAVPPLGDGVSKALPSFFLNATMPELARQNWQPVRRQMFRETGDGLEARLQAFWPIDVGNYRFNRISGLAGGAAAAAELGDTAARDSLLAALDHHYVSEMNAGSSHRPSASIWAHAMEVIARCNPRNGLHDLISLPTRNPGPYIEACRYPDVLVAKAHAKDGALEAVLYPGSERKLFLVSVAGLVPNRRYLCISREEVSHISNAGGKTRLSIPIDGRTPFRLEPADT